MQSFGVVWPVAALSFLLLYNLVFTPHFFRFELTDGRLYGNLADVLHRSSWVVLLALGMTLVIATGGVDLSVGSVMAISAGVVSILLKNPKEEILKSSVLAGVDVHGSVTAAVFIALLAATLCGMWNGLLVAYFRIQPIIATLILMVAGRGIAQLVTANQQIALAGGALRWFHYAPAAAGTGPLSWVYMHTIYPLPVDVIEAVAAVGIGIWFTRGTAMGLFIESVGNNPTASRFAGVNSSLVTFIAYTICGLTAGCAGILAAADLNGVQLDTGLTKELDAILAVCLGGTALTGGRFSLVGSVVGAVIILTLETTILTTPFRGHSIPKEWNQIVKAVLILAVCLLQSEAFRRAIKKPFNRRARG